MGRNGVARAKSGQMAQICHIMGRNGVAMASLGVAMGLEGIITNKQALPTPLRHQGMPHNGSQWCHHCDPLYGISWRRNGVGRACLFVMEAWEAIARLVKIKTVAGVTWGRASFALSGHFCEMLAGCSPS